MPIEKYEGNPLELKYEDYTMMENSIRSTVHDVALKNPRIMKILKFVLFEMNYLWVFICGSFDPIQGCAMNEDEIPINYEVFERAQVIGYAPLQFWHYKDVIKKGRPPGK